MLYRWFLPLRQGKLNNSLQVVLWIANLKGVDMFAKLQDVVAFLLLGSMVVMGLIATLARVYCASPPVVSGISAFNSETEAIVIIFIIHAITIAAINPCAYW